MFRHARSQITYALCLLQMYTLVSPPIHTSHSSHARGTSACLLVLRVLTPPLSHHAPPLPSIVPCAVQYMVPIHGLVFLFGPQSRIRTFIDTNITHGASHMIVISPTPDHIPGLPILMTIPPNSVQVLPASYWAGTHQALINHTNTTELFVRTNHNERSKIREAIEVRILTKLPTSFTPAPTYTQKQGDNSDGHTPHTPLHTNTRNTMPRSIRSIRRRPTYTLLTMDQRTNGT